jgi:amino acid transporter
MAAILTQGGYCLLLIFAVGTPRGRAMVDAALNTAGLPSLPWDKYSGGFETLLVGSAPVFWAFFLLTGISLFVLRAKDAVRERPFAVPWFPLPPIVFAATCIYMLYCSLDYARFLALLGALPLLIGLPLYAFSNHAPGHDRR